MVAEAVVVVVVVGVVVVVVAGAAADTGSREHRADRVANRGMAL